MNEKITVTKQVDIEVPQVPNFLRVDGVSHTIADFSEGDLIAVAEAWKQKLLARAKDLRVNRTMQAIDG